MVTCLNKWYFRVFNSITRRHFYFVRCWKIAEYLQMLRQVREVIRQVWTRMSHKEWTPPQFYKSIGHFYSHMTKFGPITGTAIRYVVSCFSFQLFTFVSTFPCTHILDRCWLRVVERERLLFTSLFAQLVSVIFLLYFCYQFLLFFCYQFLLFFCYQFILFFCYQFLLFWVILPSYFAVILHSYFVVILHSCYIYIYIYVWLLFALLYIVTSCRLTL